MPRARRALAMTHCMKCGTSPGGRPQGSPLRSVTRSAMGGPMWASAPTERLLMVPGAGGVEPRPYGEVARGAGKESPSHGFAVPAPFRQGGQLRTREADCHSRCAHRLRNDTLHEMRYESGRATARVAPTERNKKCHGRADVGIGSYGEVIDGAGCGRGRTPPLRRGCKRCGERIPQSRLRRASPL